MTDAAVRKTGRVLALDVGDKTIGVALSDEARSLALPDKTILRQEGWRRDMAALRDLVSSQNVQEIVVGLPLMLDGSRGVQVEKVETFIQRLRGSVRVPIYTQDERFSTGEAERALISEGLRREKRKEVVDSLAATLILQTYLERTRNATPTPDTDEEAR